MRSTPSVPLGKRSLRIERLAVMPRRRSFARFAQTQQPLFKSCVRGSEHLGQGGYVRSPSRFVPRQRSPGSAARASGL